MIKHILIPTDGSELSLKAAKLGGEFARAMRSRVTVLSVLDDEAVVAAAWGSTGGPYASTGPDISIETVRKQMESNALDNILPDAVTAIGELATLPKAEHTWGHAASGICDYAAENGVDLIVMGSHGRSGIKRVLLGSVSHAVANRAPCAVTIVR